MLSLKIIILSVFLAFTDTATSYRVLGLFPHPGFSHFDVFHPIMRRLAEDGHEVTVLSHFPDKNPPKNYVDYPITGLQTLNNAVDLAMFSNRRFYNHFLEFFMLEGWGLAACEAAYNSTGMQKVLKDKKPYDIIVMEQFNSDCMMGVAWKLNIPVIALSSCALMPWHYERFGNPFIPSYIPALFLGNSDKMTYTQRLANWITGYAFRMMYRMFNHREGNALVRKYLGDDVPDLEELVKRTSLMFVNQHYSMGGSKPLSPAIIEVGGVHIKEESKPFDADLQAIVDGADHGIIYISWGSMIRANSLPTEKREALMKAMGSIKQTVLWKWENDTVPNQPKNVFTRKWMPQKEILCHPKVRGFFGHGGLLGSSEAAYCGVPVVVTPMYGDQFLNAAALERRGMGHLLQYEDITTETVKEALKFLVSPASQENAKKVSYAFKNRQSKPLDTAVWWVEHIAATKGDSLLKSHSIEMPWYIYHSLDIYATIFGVISVTVLCWILMIRLICGRSKATTSNKQKRQ